LFNQMYYSARHHFALRIITLFIVVLVNVSFIALSSNTDNVMGWQATLGIIFASFAFLGMFVVSIYATSSTFKKLFKEPQCYFTMLTPTPSWKIILGNLIPSVIFDIFSITISLVGVVFMSLSIADGFAAGGTSELQITTYWNDIIFVIIAALAFYTLIIVANVLYNAIVKTIFHRVPLRKLFATIVTIVVLCALSWVSIVLLPLGELYRFGPFFAIELIQPAVWHMAAMVLLILAQAAVILYAAAYLMDRRS